MLKDYRKFAYHGFKLAKWKSNRNVCYPFWLECNVRFESRIYSIGHSADDTERPAYHGVMQEATVMLTDEERAEFGAQRAEQDRIESEKKAQRLGRFKTRLVQDFDEIHDRLRSRLRDKGLPHFSAALDKPTLLEPVKWDWGSFAYKVPTNKEFNVTFDEVDVLCFERARCPWDFEKFLRHIADKLASEFVNSHSKIYDAMKQYEKQQTEKIAAMNEKIAAIKCDRKAKHLCILCGHKLGFFQRILGNQQHDGCREFSE